MITSFRDQGTEDIFHKISSIAAKETLDPKFWRKAWRMLNHLDTPNCIRQFKDIRGARLEMLKKELSGYWSVRIDGQYRVIFKYNRETDSASDVAIVDYH